MALMRGLWFPTTLTWAAWQVKPRHTINGSTVERRISAPGFPDKSSHGDYPHARQFPGQRFCDTVSTQHRQCCQLADA
eukprot:9359269-Alexandrium_andersonii.AAC.1